MRIKNDYWKTCSTVPIGKRAEVEIVMISHWYHQRIRVGTVNTVGNEVEITPASPKGKFTKHPGFYRKNGRIDNPFYFENGREFIDVPYEWYHDAGEGIVYMAFPRGIKPDGVRVEAPVTETLIAVVGTAEAPVRDLEFRGLIFELANWGTPSKEGVNMTQAAQNVGGEMPKPMVPCQACRAPGVSEQYFPQGRRPGTRVVQRRLLRRRGQHLPQHRRQRHHHRQRNRTKPHPRQAKRWRRHLEQPGHGMWKQLFQRHVPLREQRQGPYRGAQSHPQSAL